VVVVEVDVVATDSAATVVDVDVEPDVLALPEVTVVVLEAGIDDVVELAATVVLGATVDEVVDVVVVVVGGATLATTAVTKPLDFTPSDVALAPLISMIIMLLPATPTKILLSAGST
jgi:alpha-D-ribose 1-methylphosphonate 5-triphosphate synthase subunit PhnI